MNGVSGLPNSNPTYELRLITRAISFLALLTGLLYLRVIAAEFLAGLRSGDLSNAAVLLLVFLLVGAAGLLLSWRWEGAGGLIALAGGVGLAAIDYRLYGQHPWLRTVLYSTPFILAGALCLLCRWQRKEGRE